MCISIYIYTYIGQGIYVCVYIYIYTHTCVYIIYIYTYMFIHTYPYIHTYAHICHHIPHASGPARRPRRPPGAGKGSRTRASLSIAYRPRGTADDKRDIRPRWWSFPRGLRLRLRWRCNSRLQIKARGSDFYAELLPVQSPLLRESYVYPSPSAYL